VLQKKLESTIHSNGLFASGSSQRLNKYVNLRCPHSFSFQGKPTVRPYPSRVPSFRRSPVEFLSSPLRGAWQNIAGDGFRQSTTTGVPRPRVDTVHPNRARLHGGCPFVLTDPASPLHGYANIIGARPDRARKSSHPTVPRPWEEITPYGRSETVLGHDRSMTRCAPTGNIAPRTSHPKPRSRGDLPLRSSP